MNNNLNNSPIVYDGAGQTLNNFNKLNIVIILTFSKSWKQKKAWEFLLSPIPTIRPSHCPVLRISNAASPRQAIIYSTTCYTLLYYIAIVGI